MSSFGAQQFYDLMGSPTEIGAEHLAELEEITRDFPAFSGARMLYLGGLKNSGSYKFNAQLKTTAAHVHQRTSLFRFIVETLEGRKSSTEAINPIPEPTDTQNIPADAPPPATPQESVEIAEEKPREAEKKTENSNDLPPLGSPLQFSRQEMHSFSEWLSIIDVAPVERTEERERESTKELTRRMEQIPDEETSQDSIIARFLEAQPRIQPIDRNQPLDTGWTPDMAQPSNQLMTETLARVYEEQGLYEKAITAYEILILKYPEKSSFFADRIRELKILTSNRD